MSRVEVVMTLGTLSLLLLVIELVRRRELAENYSLLWLLTAVALLVLSLWRELLDVLAQIAGIFYPPAALFVLGFGFVLIILLQFSVVITHLTKKNRVLTQEVALLRGQVNDLMANDEQMLTGEGTDKYKSASEAEVTQHG